MGVDDKSQMLKATIQFEKLQDLLLNGVDDKSQMLNATIQFEKLQDLLLNEGSPPAEKVIEKFIQSGVVPNFVKFVAMDDMPQLQFMAAWVLAYITYGTSKNINKVIIDHGALPIFVKLLSSHREDIRETVACALGNIAGDSSWCRDLVLSHGAMIPLLSQLNEQANVSTVKDAMWTLLNFLEGKPEPQFEQVRPALPVLRRLLFSNDEGVVASTCWAFSCLCEGPNDRIQAVIEADVCGRLVRLLLHPSPSVIIAALCTVGNIATGDVMQTQVVIDHGSLSCLLSLLTYNHDKSIQIEACRTIANIAVIDAGLIASLVNLFQNAELDIKKGVAWAFYNASAGGTNEQMKYLGSQGCIKHLCDLLACPDPEIVTLCLKGLENFLYVGKAEKSFVKKGDDVNLYAKMIDDAEGLAKIEKLQCHDNSEIHEKAVKILKTYYLLEDEDEDATSML